MKKSMIIWILALVLVVVAIYTVSQYKPSPGIAKEPAQQEQKSPETSPEPTPDAEPTPTPAVEQNGDTVTEADSRPAEEKINLIKDYNFTLEDLDGNKVSLSDFEGKKIFLNFWASWCPPCKTEMPDIEKLYQETKDGDLVILAINVGEDKKTVQDFMAKNKYNFKVLLDTDAKVGTLYQASSIPTSYFIDTEGYLDDGRVGAMDLDTMKAYVNKLK